MIYECMHINLLNLCIYIRCIYKYEYFIDYRFKEFFYPFTQNLYILAVHRTTQKIDKSYYNRIQNILGQCSISAKKTNTRSE